MLDIREFYAELKAQIEHRILPVECYADLLDYYAKRVATSDTMCDMLIEFTREKRTNWRLLFPDNEDDAIILQWIHDLLLDKYNIGNADEELRVTKVEEGMFSNYCLVEIIEKEQIARIWLVSYPRGLILVPEFLKGITLATEVNSSISMRIIEYQKKVLEKFAWIEEEVFDLWAADNQPEDIEE